MSRPLRSLALLAVPTALFAVLVSTGAQAEVAVPPGLVTYPIEYIARPLTLPKHVFEADVDFAIGLDYQKSFQPIVPTLGIFYGLTDGIQLSADFALCLNGGAGVGGDACPSAADHGGIQLTGALLNGRVLKAAVFVGFDFTQFEPRSDTKIPLGAQIRLAIVPDALALFVAPTLNIALNDRGASNFDTVNIPFDLQFQLTQKLEMQLNTGLFFLLNPPVPTSFGDSVRIPLGVSARYAFSNQFDVGAAFRFRNLLGRGQDYPQGFDYRTLFLFLEYRL